MTWNKSRIKALLKHLNIGMEALAVEVSRNGGKATYQTVFSWKHGYTKPGYANANALNVIARRSGYACNNPE